jgi:glyoxylase-like metal-dependent hydrolase (beta-lactamase superfamily II)
MLKVETFSLGALATNAYLLTVPASNKGVVIDPGADPEPLLQRTAGLQIEAILLTHAHFDHIAGVEAVRRRHGCPVYIHELEAAWLTDPAMNGSLLWPDISAPVSTAPPEHHLADQQQLSFLGQTILVMHTPGHSPGSVSFLLGPHLFSGDVLFRMSVGRTDLPGGNAPDLYRSIKQQLFPLPDETIVYPGHGPATTIGCERRFNPYVAEEE